MHSVQRTRVHSCPHSKLNPAINWALDKHRFCINVTCKEQFWDEVRVNVVLKAAICLRGVTEDCYTIFPISLTLC